MLNNYKYDMRTSKKANNYVTNGKLLKNFGQEDIYISTILLTHIYNYIYCICNV